MKALMKNSIATLISASLFVGWVFVLPPPSYGGAPTEEYQEYDVKRALSAAEMVFHGTVGDVKYRLSEDGTPHAFVTYGIEKILRGQVRSEDKMAITLRFIGGPKGDGTFLIVSGVPNFRVGDQDVLFVRGNGETQCPLVYCGYGRFRVLNNRIYNFKGVPVIGVREGRIIAAGLAEPELQLVRFPAPTFDQVYKRKEVQEHLRKEGREVDFDELRRRYEKEAPREIILEPASDVAKEKGNGSTTGEESDNDSQSRVGEREEPMSLEAFIEVLAREVRSLKDRPAPVESLDPGKPFSFKLPAVSAPIEPTTVHLEPDKALSERDEEELRMLQQQDFDPVIRSKPREREEE